MRGNFICVSSPPTCLPQTFSFPAFTAATKPIGVVLATPAASEQQLVFKIAQVWGYNAKPQWGARVGVNASLYNNGTFAINSCSGVITIVESWKMDSRFVQNFTILVQILPDGETYGSIFVNMTLIMIGEIALTSIIASDVIYPHCQFSLYFRNSSGACDEVTAFLQRYRVVNIKYVLDIVAIYL